MNTELKNSLDKLIHQERHKEAVIICDELLKTEPHDVPILSKKARSLYKLQRIEEALQANTIAHSLDDTNPDIAELQQTLIDLSNKNNPIVTDPKMLWRAGLSFILGASVLLFLYISYLSYSYVKQQNLNVAEKDQIELSSDIFKNEFYTLKKQVSDKISTTFHEKWRQLDLSSRFTIAFITIIILAFLISRLGISVSLGTIILLSVILMGVIFYDDKIAPTVEHTMQRLEQVETKVDKFNSSVEKVEHKVDSVKEYGQHAWEKTKSYGHNALEKTKSLAMKLKFW